MIFDIFRKKVRVRVSGIILRDDTLLMIAHKKNNEIYWLLPGGGVMYGESLTEALSREFHEELGIRVSIGKPALMCDSIDPSGKRHILNIAFRCDHRGGEYRIGKDRRLHDYGFFRKEELAAMRIYPPINMTLASVVEKRDHEFYLGSLWQQ